MPLPPDELCRQLEAQYFGEQMHERDEIELLPALLRDARVFVDVGASLGQYAFFAGKTIRGGRIVCVEADPVRYARLRELAAEWEKQSGNRYEVLHAAAADAPGTAEFFVTGQNLSGGLFQHSVGDESAVGPVNWSAVTVQVVTLDALFPDGDPDLVKIDVEGAEYRVLLGAHALLSRGRTRFLVEVHPWGDEPVKKTPADVFALFAAHGYDFSRTHRHWHFEKRGNALVRWGKLRAITFVMNRPWLKDRLKALILRFSRHDVPAS